MEQVKYWSSPHRRPPLDHQMQKRWNERTKGKQHCRWIFEDRMESWPHQNSELFFLSRQVGLHVVHHRIYVGPTSRIYQGGRAPDTSQQEGQLTDVIHHLQGWDNGGWIGTARDRPNPRHARYRICTNEMGIINWICPRKTENFAWGSVIENPTLSPIQTSILFLVWTGVLLRLAMQQSSLWQDGM